MRRILNYAEHALSVVLLRLILDIVIECEIFICGFSNNLLNELPNNKTEIESIVIQGCKLKFLLNLWVFVLQFYKPALLSSKRS